MEFALFVGSVSAIHIKSILESENFLSRTMYGGYTILKEYTFFL